jgi:sugar phosphate isomerase/epimerase
VIIFGFKVNLIMKKVYEACVTSDMFNYHFNPPMDKRLKIFREYGFEYIHWCDNWHEDVFYSDQTIERYCRLIKEAGLQCIDVHGTATHKIRIDTTDPNLREKCVQLLENRVRFCAAAEGDSVVVHPPSGKPKTAILSENLNRSLQVFEDVRPLCEELGITLAIENCSRAAEEQLRFYFERFPSGFVGFYFDCGHAHYQKNFSQLKAFADRLKVLHLSDNKGVRDAHQPPFWGTVDWGAVVSWIKSTGYSKPINFEVTHYSHFFNGTMIEFLNVTSESIKKVMAMFES